MIFGSLTYRLPIRPCPLLLRRTFLGGLRLQRGEFVNDTWPALTVKTNQICLEVVSRANDRLRDMDV